MIFGDGVINIGDLDRLKEHSLSHLENGDVVRTKKFKARVSHDGVIATMEIDPPKGREMCFISIGTVPKEQPLTVEVVRQRMSALGWIPKPVPSSDWKELRERNISD
jgi:hypothetical protein